MGNTRIDSITVAQAMSRSKLIHVAGIGSLCLSWGIGLVLLYVFDQFELTQKLKALSFFFFLSSFVWLFVGYSVAYAHWFVWAYNRVDHPMLLTRIAVLEHKLTLPQDNKLNRFILTWGVDRELYQKTWERIYEVGSIEDLASNLPEDRVINIERKKQLLNWSGTKTMTFTPEALILDSETILWTSIDSTGIVKYGSTVYAIINLKIAPSGKSNMVDISGLSLPYHEIDCLIVTYMELYRNNSFQNTTSPQWS